MEVRTEAGLLTFNAAGLLLTPDPDAVICTVPTATPLASPAPLTGATLGFVLDHVNVIPLKAVPYWS